MVLYIETKNKHKKHNLHIYEHYTFLTSETRLIKSLIIVT